MQGCTPPLRIQRPIGAQMVSDVERIAEFFEQSFNQWIGFAMQQPRLLNLPPTLCRRERVPDPNRAVAGGGGQYRAVRAESDGVHVALVPAQYGEQLERLCVPDDDVAVVSAGDQARSVRTEGESVHIAKVTGKTRQSGAAGEIPYGGPELLETQRKLRSIRAERECGELRRLPAEQYDLLAGGLVDHLYAGVRDLGQQLPVITTRNALMPDVAAGKAYKATRPIHILLPEDVEQRGVGRRPR